MPQNQHVLAYTVALGTVANTDIAALTDPVISIRNGHFFFNNPAKLMAAWCGSATLSRVRLFSPSIGINGSVRPYLRPLDRAAAPPDQPAIADMTNNMWSIRPDEELVVEATSGIAMGTERFTAILFALLNGQTQVQPASPGEIVRLRFTGSAAAVANVWTQVAITFESSLPGGRYAIVGGSVIGANHQAFRWILQNQVPRPGGLCSTAVGNDEWQKQLNGRMGQWGEFDNDVLPQLEVLVNGTDAITEGFIDLVKIG